MAKQSKVKTSAVFTDTVVQNTVENRRSALIRARAEGMNAIWSEDFTKAEGSVNLYVIDHILKPIGFFKERITKKIEVEDIIPVWELFIDLCKEINKRQAFTPTIFTFCNFLNVSSRTFNAIKEENTERGELCRYISDSLSDRIMQLLLENKIPQIPGIFVAKANFGMRDNDQPVTNVIINDAPNSIDDIIKMYKKG